MDLEAFLSENIKASGALSRESYLSVNYPEVYKNIIDFSRLIFSDQIGFKEKIYRFFHNDIDEKKCVCGKNLKFKSISIGFSIYCDYKCANKNSQDKIKSIKSEKYGDPNYNNKEKFSLTLSKKSLEEKMLTNEKRKKTKMLIYGDENYTNTEKIKRSRKNTTLFNINDKIKEYSCEAVDILDDSSYLIKCHKCGNANIVLNSRLNDRIRNSQDVCIVCNNYNSGTSESETKILNFIDSLDINYEKNTRKILNGKEIDIFFPQFNLGIEFNGLFWHSEFNISNNYHLEKTELAEKNGIKLIHIWEDDWENRREIIKSRLCNVLKIPKNKIYARKCKIEIVDYKQTKKFLDENHLQGFCPFKTSIGLFYDGILVSISTFGKRKISGSVEEELLRFANKTSYNITGAFSKLLKYYIDNYKKGPLISFADRCWTTIENNVYEKNGFRFIGKTPPNYYYIVDHKRKHRFSFRKDKLVRDGFDPNKTEKEIMQERGIFRIYDSGQLKYILD